MIDKKLIPIIRGIGWGSLIIGTTKDVVDSFLSTEGNIIQKYQSSDVYFVSYQNYGIVVNYSSLDDKVNAIFFYNKDEDYEYMPVFPFKTKENICWDSTIFL